MDYSECKQTLAAFQTKLRRGCQVHYRPTPPKGDATQHGRRHAGKRFSAFWSRRQQQREREYKRARKGYIISLPGKVIRFLNSFEAVSERV